MTKSSNWEIITENLVKDKMRLRMKNLNIFGVYWKIWLLREKGEGSRKTNIEGGMPRKGELGQLANLSGGGGGLEERARWHFWRGVGGGGWYSNAHNEMRLKLTTQQSALLVAEY